MTPNGFQSHQWRLSLRTETGRVVVADRLGVSKSLEERVGLQDDVLDFLDLRARPGDCGNVLHDQFGRLCVRGGVRKGRREVGVLRVSSKSLVIDVFSTDGVAWRGVAWQRRICSFRRTSLAGTRLARDDDALVLRLI